MTERLEVDVLLVGRLMEFAVEALDRSVRMLDGRDPAERARLVQAHAGTIRAIATNGHDGASRALIESLPHLEIIACFSAGVDEIDVAAAAERGIPVTSTSDVLADDVADVAIAHCLLLLRRFRQADRFVRDGSWTAGQFPLARSIKGRAARYSWHGRHRPRDRAARRSHGRHRRLHVPPAEERAVPLLPRTCCNSPRPAISSWCAARPRRRHCGW